MSSRCPRLHANIWVFPGLFPGRYLLYFDVGVEIRMPPHRRFHRRDDPIDSFWLLLPFRVEDGFRIDTFQKCEDMAQKMTNQETAELIFGGPVALNSGLGGLLEVEPSTADPMRIGHINTWKTKPVSDFIQHTDSSLYEIFPLKAVQPGESVYFRMRFRVFELPPIWTPKHYLGGAIVDFRMSDVRESRHVDHEAWLRGRIVKMHRTDVFLMAPEAYQLANRSPEPKYMRVLEPHAWRQYNDGADYRRTQSRYLVYSWRNGLNSAGEADPVSQDRPFRVFADFNRSIFASPWLAILLAAVILAFGVSIGEFFLWLWGLRQSHHVRWDVILRFSGLATLTGILASTKRLASFFTGRAITLRSYLRVAERFLLRKVYR